MAINIIIILLFSILTLHAEDFIATTSGSSSQFRSCSIAENYGVLKLDYGEHKLEEKTSNSFTQKDIENLRELSSGAITGIEKHGHIWSPTQTYYGIQNKDGDLVNFLGKGFHIIPNKSVEATKLVNKIDHLCQSSLNDFKIIGEFEISLKIGNKTLTDYLAITREYETDSVYSLRPIIATYEVPGSFTSRLEKLSYANGYFSFVIRVQEGEEDYKLLFAGRFTSTDSIEGSAYTIRPHGNFGTFTGKRINP